MTKNDFIKNITAAFLFAFCCSAFQPGSALAQQAPWAKSGQPEIQAPPELPNQYQSNDSLNQVENELTVSDSLQEPKVSFANVDVPVYEDSIYRARLGALITPVSLTYNEEIKKYINLYVLNRRDQVSRMLGLSKIYFPVFDQIFSQYGIPPEVKYLAIIESALNPHAVSRMGATGMWQFMYGTAKQYGLTINSYVDERKDILRSTEGAAQYLRGMYDVYGDWLLAIASYNCGPGNVNRAISLSGGKTFWEIRDYLPKETRNYVPAFIAATYVMTYYELHDLSPAYPKYTIESIATVDISDKMACDQIASLTGLTLEEFKFLNPGLKCSVIPGAPVYSYACKLPGDRVSMFHDNKDSIIYLSQNAKTTWYPGNTSGSAKTYTVRSGDNLGKIAQKYNVSVTQLKKWNKLSSSTIRAGQKLKVSSPYTATASSTASTTVKKNIAPVAKSDTLQATAKSTDTSLTKTASVNKDKSNNSLQKTYTVRPGDNLTSIAVSKKVTVAQLKEWNNISGTTIKSGQKLKLYEPAALTNTQASDGEKQKLADQSSPTNGSGVIVTDNLSNNQDEAGNSITKTTYTVKKGDYLLKIAEQHHVTVADIKSWNKLTSNTVWAGQKLSIHTRPTATVSNSTQASTEGPTNKVNSTVKSSAGTAISKPIASNYVYYKARNGDTLWEIAQRYGTTVSEIRKLNGATKCNNLKVGTVLKLSSKG